jgi:hypothetical protein
MSKLIVKYLAYLEDVISSEDAPNKLIQAVIELIVYNLPHLRAEAYKLLSKIYTPYLVFEKVKDELMLSVNTGKMSLSGLAFMNVEICP